MLSGNFLEKSLQEVCLLGDSKSNQIDEKDVKCDQNAPPVMQHLQFPCLVVPSGDWWPSS